MVLKEGQSCDCGFDTNNNPVGVTQVTLSNPDGSKSTINGCPWDDPNSSVKKGSGGKYVASSISDGEFTYFRMYFFNKAKISGCVTGNFKASTHVTAGKHTYCTRSNKAYTNNTGGGANSDFENQAPQEMDFDLAKVGAKNVEELVIDTPIEGGLKLTDPATPPSMTIVIDVNRMLRYYNMGRTDQGPNPGALTDKTYFFSSVFEDSINGFAGKAGNVYGYQWLGKFCDNVEEASIPSDYICSSSNRGVVAGWLTVITNPSGTPLGFNFMPDDDNTAPLKGGNRGAGGFIDGAIKSTSSGVYDLKFYLGKNNESSGSFYGYQINQKSGEKIEGFKARGHVKSHGQVTLIRKL